MSPRWYGEPDCDHIWEMAEDTKRRYYHASQRRLPNIMEPEGYFEKVDESGESVVTWSPIMNVPPITPVSDVKESAFAKTIGGAALGSVSASREAGKLYIYETPEHPDIDLSRDTNDWFDFNVTREVRYRKPVCVRLLGTIPISEDDVERVNRAYRPEIEFQEKWEKKRIEGKLSELEEEFPPEGEWPPNKNRLERLAKELGERLKRE